MALERKQGKGTKLAGGGRLLKVKHVEDMSVSELLRLQKRYPARFIRVLDKTAMIKVPIGLLHILDTGA